MAGIDWRALLVKVQQYILYFLPFFLIGLAVEVGLDTLLARWRNRPLVKAWLAAWDNNSFGGKGEGEAQPWWYHALLALRIVAGPVALILAWRWSGRLLWLRLFGGLLVAGALLLIISRTRRVQAAPAQWHNVTVEDAVNDVVTESSGAAEPPATLLAAIDSGQISDAPERTIATSPTSTATIALPPAPNPLKLWWRSLDSFLGRAFGHRLDWLGLKAAIVLIVGGFLALILPYKVGVDAFGGILPILLFPLVGYFLPTSGGADMAVVIVLASKGMSLGAAFSFILASPLIYRARLEEVELLNGRKAMFAYAAVGYALPVALGMALYLIFPAWLLLLTGLLMYI